MPRLSDWQPKIIQKLSTKKIYLIRHGQTEFNRLGIVQGSGVDTRLNALGQAQAQAFFHHYKHISFDRVYTSKLRRSIESVQPFLDLGIPHEPLTALNEISWGQAEGQPVTAEADASYSHLLSRWREGATDFAIPGGESPEDVRNRLEPAMKEILGRADEQQILICMHGRAMRVLLCYLTGIPLQAMDDFDHTNLCLYLLHHDGMTTHIERRNDVSHLSLLM